MTRALNNEWLAGSLTLTISRFCALALLGGLEVVLSDPELPEDTAEEVRRVGAQTIEKLLQAGLPVLEEIRKGWEKSFRIKLPEGRSKGGPSPTGKV